MRLRAKTDANHKTIVRGLRDRGYSVRSTAATGKDFPDLVVGGPMACAHCGALKASNLLVEVKNKKGRNRLSPGQERFLAEWRGPVVVAHTIDDVLAAIGRKER